MAWAAHADRAFWRWPGLGLQPGPAWRRCGWAALAFAAAALLPPLVHGAPVFWGWGLLAAGLGALVAAPAWQGRNGCGAAPWWACPLALGGGLVLDFFNLPPLALLSLCSSAEAATVGLAALAAHGRWLPITTAAMVLALAAPRLLLPWPAAAAPGARAAAWAHRLGLSALEVAAMLLAMPLAVRLAQALAAHTPWPWTPDAMGAAMLAGMVGASALVARCSPAPAPRA